MAPVAKKQLKRKRKPAGPTPSQIRKMRTMIDGMDEHSEMQKQAKNAYDEVRGQVLAELIDVWNDNFEETHEGVRRKASVIRGATTVIEDTILEDLKPDVVNKVTQLQINPAAFAEACASGDIDAATVLMITTPVIDGTLLNAAIERHEIPMAVVEKHTTVNEKRPYPKITRKSS